ncbi:MAG: alpha-glucosidase C-terminal domain-containing protein [Anaerolineae bacterium]|nr:alpha-glucosidase C-terminal domain-containing protein [Anaerolineae bacterium]
MSSHHNAHWINDAVFYHIYPLGLCGAPARNDFCSSPEPRLEKIYGWLDHLQYLGVNTLYLGPVFESGRHGYDTADYFRVDRRLGTNDTLRDLSAELHRRGMRLVLDGVFNHVGRDFWAFCDVLAHGEASAYCDWFAGLRFGESTPYHDPFTYGCWDGHYSLPKLNLHNPAVADHLFQAVAMWINTFGADGLRLDAADCVDRAFWERFAAFCRDLRPDFWLMGEIVRGDYRQWANARTLDSVTNYECYKGLYSSHVDRNYFEIAYSLKRLFGPGGLYRDLVLYNFADNHDVNRVASSLTNPADLYPLYCLLFTMPGVPSIYYGSEWGIAGEKSNGSDRALRPALELGDMNRSNPQPGLPAALARLARTRRAVEALRYGDYHELCKDHEQLVFVRQANGSRVVVIVNASDQPVALDLDLSAWGGAELVDVLNDGGDVFPVRGGRARVDPVWSRWARIMVLR